MSKHTVIVITGATASGKTALAVKLCERYNGEVISADSMQVYKGMNIATAKPTQEEMNGIPHHLIDFLPVSEKYSVAAFKRDAEKKVLEIEGRGKTPVIAGGTGLYIDALINNISFEDEPDNTVIREELNSRLKREGINRLYQELTLIDPDEAAVININNTKRVLRAIEMYLLTGEKPSVLKKRAVSQKSDFIPVFIGLCYRDRSVLYERINRRVDDMLQKGLLAEALEFYGNSPKNTAVQAIGYKELKPYLDGKCSLSEALEKLKQATRNYAKRQLTWFRKNENINRIYCDDYECFEQILDAACDIIDKSGLFKGGN